MGKKIFLSLVMIQSPQGRTGKLPQVPKAGIPCPFTWSIWCHPTTSPTTPGEHLTIWRCVLGATAEGAGVVSGAAI